MTTKVQGRAFILCNNSKQGQAIFKTDQFEFERRPEIIVLNNSSVHKLRGLRSVSLIVAMAPGKNITHSEQYELFKYLMRKLREDSHCAIHFAHL